VEAHGGYLNNVERLGSKFDGIITHLMSSESPIACLVKSSRAPTVDLTDKMMELDLPRVLLDDRAIGQMGAEHLINQGFEDLAFLRIMNSGQTKDRARGFNECVEQQGKTLHQLDLSDGLLVRTLAAKLQALPRPLGIMAHYDAMYRYVVAACALAELRIPEDVAVVSVGNTTSICELSEPTLTSIDNNAHLQGYEAASLLGQLMDGVASPVHLSRVAPLRVVVRESTDFFAVHDECLRTALDFLRDHFRDPTVRVADVVKACGVSRRHLYTTFEQHWTSSIGHTLTELRIAEAKRLLATTSEKHYSVALRSGFTNESHFSRAFAKHVGVTPGAWRSDATEDGRH
jgi:LacI family transcriptional regulator